MYLKIIVNKKYVATTACDYLLLLKLEKKQGDSLA